MINEDKYIKFITENKLTQPQFLLLHLVYRNRWDLIKLYREIFPTGDGTIIGKSATEDLLERGLLKYTKDTSNTLHIQVGDVFKKAYTNDVFVAEDIYEAYPSFYEDNDGVKYPLKAYDRMSFAKIYLDKINYSQEEHEEILEDIKYGKENSLIKIKIGNFLVSEFWKDLRKLRKESQVDNINVIDNAEDFS
jgi:hypothetical protein